MRGKCPSGGFGRITPVAAAVSLPWLPAVITPVASAFRRKGTAFRRKGTAARSDGFCLRPAAQRSATFRAHPFGTAARADQLSATLCE